tara:strand:+ start:294 stop:1316 length:1023 start_codon:yes stop_codon:yes gene_type:complete
MKLLIITQVVDTQHPILGFFHRWIVEFAKHVEHLHVVALQVGEYDLPKNVTVHSLGKEEGVSKLEYVRRFYSYTWKYRNEYDSVFVHMNQIYVLLGMFIWQGLKKRVLLWYMHKSVTTSLKFAHAFVDGVASASKESFRVKSKKLHILGHGIDTELFAYKNKAESKMLKILSVGRIAPVKQIEVLIAAVLNCGNSTLSVVGAPITKTDKVYEEGLKKEFGTKVSFLGAKTQEELPFLYQGADVFVNTSNTGSIDKVVLEAMSTGTLVISTNEAFKDMFSRLPYSAYVEEHNVLDLTKTLEEVSRIPLKERESIGLQLRELVKEQHALSGLVPKILAIYEK